MLTSKLADGNELMVVYLRFDKVEAPTKWLREQRHEWTTNIHHHGMIEKYGIYFLITMISAKVRNLKETLIILPGWLVTQKYFAIRSVLLIKIQGTSRYWSLDPQILRSHFWNDLSCYSSRRSTLDLQGCNGLIWTCVYWMLIMYCCMYTNSLNSLKIPSLSISSSHLATA